MRHKIEETPNKIYIDLWHKGKHARLTILRLTNETQLQMKVRGIRTAMDLLKKWGPDADSESSKHTA